MNSYEWLNSNWFASVIGAIIGAFISLLTSHINKKNQEKNEKKNLLTLIIQSNGKLFSMIYRGALNENKIDYYELRKELSNCNFIWVMPEKLRDAFSELYKIHSYGPEKYESNKHRIHSCLVRINEELNRYGVEIFGDK